MKKIILNASALALLLLAAACGNSKEEVQQNNDSVKKDSLAVKDTAAELKEFKFFMILANIPSPAHEVIEVNKAGMKYNSAVLNPVDNESKYQDDFKKAINYGVYCSDLAYVASFKDNSDLMKYFGATRKMADKAGALSTFEEVMTQEHFTDHVHNSDSLELILDKIHVATEKFCEESHRLDAATKILVGSWIESQYLMLSHLKGVNPTEKNKALFEKIWQNYLHLRNILELLKEYNTPEFTELNTQLTNYSQHYKDTHGTEDFTKDKVSKMAEEMAIIRNKLIN